MEAPTSRTAGLVLACSLAVASVDASACGQGEKPIFSCTTTKKKIVAVCAGKANATYSFGRAGMKPEMRLVLPKQKLLYRSDSGTAAESKQLTFTNGKTTYTVFLSHSFVHVDENGVEGEEFPDEGSLEVAISGREVASLQCDGDTLRTDFEALAMQPASPD